jgi:hypothetical protein
LVSILQRLSPFTGSGHSKRSGEKEINLLKEKKSLDLLAELVLELLPESPLVQEEPSPLS